MPRIISTYATESHLSGAIFDIFCRARIAPNMAPKATVIAQQYEQREYDEAYWAEYEAELQREIEEKIALMELEKNKEAGGEEK